MRIAEEIVVSLDRIARQYGGMEYGLPIANKVELKKLITAAQTHIDRIVMQRTSECCEEINRQLTMLTELSGRDYSGLSSDLQRALRKLP